MTHCNSSTGVSLVILAAGLGRRFGGNKPLAPIGDTGKPLMYFSVRDACHAGVRRLVLIISPDSEEIFKTRFLPYLPADLNVSLVYQNSQDLPLAKKAAPREKPWGTGHALWCARDVVPGPMIVINADDYYGRDAFERLSHHFANGPDWAMASYPLARTLSISGAVNRGLCEVRDGFLAGISECHAIREDGGLILSGSLDGTATLAPTTPVSMNVWGFDTRVFDHLKRGLERFITLHGRDNRAEYYLPHMVAQALAESVRVRVYKSRDAWFGITYPEDLANIENCIAEVTGDER